MPTFRTGSVTTILSEREGLQRVEVDGRKAYVLRALTGDVAVGDRVVVNTTAVELGLGTGGWDVVHWNLERDAWDGAGAGHVMKLRYTSLQCDTGVAEERPGYAEPTDLHGLPVVICTLHSHLAPVAAAFKHGAPAARLVYVMTDWAALPLALSDLVADLRHAGLVDGTVTAGQAFGGDQEAVNVPSALRVARVAEAADAIVVAPGPGGVGTGTAYGFSALEAAGVIRSVSRDDAVPIVAVRWSDADERDRHHGLSHHTRAVLLHAETGAWVAVPADTAALDVHGHERIEVADMPDVGELLERAGIAVRTMGRSPKDDPAFFRYAGAAGAAAAAAVAKGVMQ